MSRKKASQIATLTFAAACIATTTIAAPPSRDVDVEGTVETLIEDLDHASRLHHFLVTDDGTRYPMRFNGRAPELPTGARVRAHGVESDGSLYLAAGGTSSVQTIAVPPAQSFGNQTTIVILVNFQDAPTSQPWTVANAQSVVFDTVSAYFLENSFQQTWLSGSVYGWYTIPVSSTACDTTAIQSYADQAATAAGANLSSYAHRVYAFPYDSACGWNGYAQVSGALAWINGSLDAGTVAHELGHNFGLYHSHSLECGATTIGTNCTTYEYGDTFDTMGYSSTTGHFNAFQKERIGWLNYGSSPPITTVSASGTYSLEPYEASGTGAKALKILKSTDPTTGQRTWYYVEYRQAIGFDGFLSSFPNVTGGVVVHIGSESGGNTSDLLDMTPASSTYYDWNDPALDAGKSFSDPSAGVTVNVLSVSSSGASVSVTVAATACSRATPAVSMSPSQAASVAPGTAVTYTVSVTNLDSAGCSASSFNLAGAVPSGWSGSLGSSTLSLSPGAAGTASFTVTSSTSATAGTYPIGVTAKNGSSSTSAASASASYVVSTSGTSTKKRK
jgi:Gametolysin peptidase M11/NPCBM-associated, NEW3 domain of alpha-galactosidase